MSEKLGSIIDPGSSLCSEFVASLKRVERTTFGPANTFDALVKDLSVRANIPEGITIFVIDYVSLHRIEGSRMKRREALAALLYIFSKNDPRLNKSIGEICEATGSDRRLVGKYITRFVLDAELPLRNKQPEDYLNWIASKLSVTGETLQRTRELIGAFRKCGPSGITPRSIAASALYLAATQSGSKFTQAHLASAFGVDEYTVREDSSLMKKCLAAVLG